MNEFTPKCECCGEPLHADFSNNVWCANEECYLFDRIYDWDDFEEDEEE